jgi:hypothetical protein
MQLGKAEPFCGALLRLAHIGAVPRNAAHAVPRPQIALVINGPAAPGSFRISRSASITFRSGRRSTQPRSNRFGPTRLLGVALASSTPDQLRVTPIGWEHLAPQTPSARSKTRPKSAPQNSGHRTWKYIFRHCHPYFTLRSPSTYQPAKLLAAAPSLPRPATSACYPEIEKRISAPHGSRRSGAVFLSTPIWGCRHIMRRQKPLTPLFSTFAASAATHNASPPNGDPMHLSIPASFCASPRPPTRIPPPAISPEPFNLNGRSPPTC